MNGSSGVCVGIDVGGSHLRGVAGDEGRERGPVAAGPTPDGYPAFLDRVEELAHLLAGPARPERVACGLPGTTRQGRAAYVPALPWIEDRPVREDLETRLGCPVVLALDGHLTLLGEVREGAARGCASAVLVAVGTGVGGAVMTGGRLWRGHRGSAGSWGWLPAEGTRPDPAHGPYEQAASGASLDRRAAACVPPMDGPGLMAAARRGEEGPLRVVEGYARELGRGLAALASIFDPEVVVVAGGLSAAMDVLGPLVERVRQEWGSPDGRLVPVRPALLGPDAGVVGALWAAREEESAWS